jgi:cobalt/nickel transport system permease protein
LTPAVLDRSSRGASFFHRRDPRAKLVGLFVFLVALATTSHGLAWFALGMFLSLVAAFVGAGVPVWPALAGAAAVLPLAAIFGAVSWMSGESARALPVALKSYLSALAVLFVMATTPLAALLRGLERIGVPGFFLAVTQLLYRYLFVISEEARHMNRAAAARGGGRIGWFNPVRFRAPAGALAVLFARAYTRAEEIHRAMLARGFPGRLPSLDARRFDHADALFAASVCALAGALRYAAGRLTW